MKLRALILGITLIGTLTSLVGTATAQTLPAKPVAPPPRGAGGPSADSAEMQALLESFHLTADQRAKYDAAKTETGKRMREIHEGKVSGTLPQDEVLKQALAAHKAFNAAVKEILTPEQYAKWEPLREADHHKIAQAHKERDAAAAAAGTDPAAKPKTAP